MSRTFTPEIAAFLARHQWLTGPGDMQPAAFDVSQLVTGWTNDSAESMGAKSILTALTVLAEVRGQPRHAAVQLINDAVVAQVDGTTPPAVLDGIRERARVLRDYVMALRVFEDVGNPTPAPTLADAAESHPALRVAHHLEQAAAAMRELAR